MPTNPPMQSGDNPNRALEILTQMGLTTPENVLRFIEGLQTQPNQAIPPSENNQMEDVQPTQSMVISPVKMAQPRHFSKQSNPGELNMWIQDIEAYIHSGSIRGAFRTEMEKINLAASYLSGEARLNWNVAKQYSDITDELDQKIDTMERFFAHVRQANTNWNEQDQIRRKYMNFRQRKSVSDYGTQLLLYANQLVPRPSENEILERFKFGLQERIRRELARVFDPPTQVRSFIALCDRIDKQLWEYRITQFKPEHLLHALPTRRFPLNEHQPNSLPTKGTTEWKNYCYKENRCLECGKPGHKKSQCHSQLESSHRSSYDRTKPFNNIRHTTRPITGFNQSKAITFDVSKAQNQGKGPSRS